MGGFRLLCGAFLMLCSSVFVPQMLAGGDGPRPFETFRDTLLAAEIDSSTVRQVSSLVFEDGLITISLDSGRKDNVRMSVEIVFKLAPRDT